MPKCKLAVQPSVGKVHICSLPGTHPEPGGATVPRQWPDMRYMHKLELDTGHAAVAAAASATDQWVIV